MNSEVGKRIQRELISCWRDPSAAPDVAARYRFRQFHALAHQLPISNFGSVLVGIAVTLVFWAQIVHWILLVWLGGLVALAAADLFLWWRRRSMARDAPVSRGGIWLLAAGMAAAALLYASMGVYLFNRAGTRDRLILTAVIAALIATGSWLFACLPQAGVLWATILCFGLAVGIGVTQGSTYILLVPLLGFFAAVMVATVLMTSRMFVLGLVAETEIERQRELMGLLLHDFEESASDWLWEADANGCLTRVSARLGETFGLPPEELQGKSMVEALEARIVDPDPDWHRALDALASSLAGRTPFRGLVVPTVVAGGRRWWSITAKPLSDRSGQFVGWRGVGTDVTAARLREDEMAHLANFDTLTGLANRHQFMRRLMEYFSPPADCTLILLDLDNFKAVNDSLGHVAGDRLLEEVARRMHDAVAEEGLLARLGGDEFALLVAGQYNPERVEHLGARLQAGLAAPIVLEGHRIEVRASIGVGFAPSDADSAEDLLKAADMALYAAKAAGRQTLRFFDRQMDLDAQQRLSVLSDLRSGLEHQEFELYYQPQVDLASGRPVGFEALVRSKHHTLGLISPEDFIPAAEESGFIVPLGAWIISQACADAAQWPREYTVAVNIAARQFSSFELLDVVESALRASGLESHRLEVEITESTLVSDSESAMVVLGMLRDMGVRVAVDDFGTGYSSLAYLRTFPLDKLKIDQSFISRLSSEQGAEQDRAIVRTIVELAKTLKFKTVAEGVETPDQRRALRKIGCDLGQGFLFSEPLSPDVMRLQQGKFGSKGFDELVH